jgi:hypothetical protein
MSEPALGVASCLLAWRVYILVRLKEVSAGVVQRSVELNTGQHEYTILAIHNHSP